MLLLSCSLGHRTNPSLLRLISFYARLFDGFVSRRRDGARRNSDAVPRRLDGVQAQPRRALSTASATASLDEITSAARGSLTL